MPEDARTVFTERAAWYAASAVHRDPRSLARLVEWAAPAPSARVLDLGTGTGHLALALAPRVARVVGLDPTRAMLREAQAEALRRGVENADFLLGDAEDLPFRDGAFDLVTCRRAAHHFVDLPRALAEARRVLRPNGRLLVDDRSVPEDAEADRLQNALDVLHDPSHVRERPPSEWRALLAAAGMHVLRLETYETSRPFEGFWSTARPADGETMRALARDWTPAQRRTMGANERGEVERTTHWFLTVLAVPFGAASS